MITEDRSCRYFGERSALRNSLSARAIAWNSVALLWNTHSGWTMVVPTLCMSLLREWRTLVAGWNYTSRPFAIGDSKSFKMCHGVSFATFVEICASCQPVRDNTAVECGRGSRSFRTHGTGVEIGFQRMGGTVLARRCCKCAIKFVTKHFLYEHSKLFR